MEAEIHKLSEKANIPEFHSQLAAGFDIACLEDMLIGSRSLAKLRTGLVIKPPMGHFTLIVARSSLALKKGLMLANGVGIIDPDYSGPEDEILILVYNFTENEVRVSSGERIAQGIFLPVNRSGFKFLDKIEGGSRGGVGSTSGYR